MEIRNAVPEDAPAACDVIRRSISELCSADHPEWYDYPRAMARQENPRDRCVLCCARREVPQGKPRTTDPHAMLKTVHHKASSAPLRAIRCRSNLSGVQN